MIRILCCVLFSSWIICNTQACEQNDVFNPTIKASSLTPVIGSTLKISCQTQSPLPAECLLYGLKLQKGITDVASYLSQSRCFVSMVASTASRWIVMCSGNEKVEVTISNVDKSDAGVFRCSNLNEYSDKITINVYYPATNVFLNVGKSLVKENSRETVVLTCAASGGNPAYYDYMWLFERYGGKAQVLREQRSSTLTLNLVKYTNAGQYRCDVINDGGKTSSNVVSLYVQHKPVVQSILPPELRIESLKQGSVVLTFEAKPEVARVTCSKVGQTVSQSRQPTKVQKTGTNVWTVSYTQVSIGDYGNYTCTASNSEGSTSVKIIIGSPGPPEAPKNITAAPVDTNKLKVGWISGFDGGSSQQFTVKFRKKGSSEEFQQISGISDPGYNRPQSYTIENLEVDTKYEIIVSATNRFTSAGGDPAVAGQVISGKTKDRAALGAGVLAAIILPILVLLICLAVVAFCVLRQTRKQKQTKTSKATAIRQGVKVLPVNHGVVNGDPIGYDEPDREVTLRRAYFKRPSQQEEATYANVGFQPDPKVVGADGTIYVDVSGGIAQSQSPQEIIGDTGDDAQYAQLDMSRKGPNPTGLDKKQPNWPRNSAVKKDTEV